MTGVGRVEEGAAIGGADRRGVGGRRSGVLGLEGGGVLDFENVGFYTCIGTQMLMCAKFFTLMILNCVCMFV